LNVQPIPGDNPAQLEKDAAYYEQSNPEAARQLRARAAMAGQASTAPLAPVQAAPVAPVVTQPTVSQPQPAGTPAPARGNAVADLIRQRAQAAGEDPDFFVRMGQIESSLNPNARAKSSTAKGLFQFIDDTWAGFGQGQNVFDPTANTEAAIRLTRSNRDFLKKSLGRDPLQWELYLAHQQGAKGAVDLIKNPLVPASDLVGARAVTNNGGTAEMTANEFAMIWQNKWNGTKVRTPTSQGVNTKRDVFPTATFEAPATFTLAQKAIREIENNTKAAGFFEITSQQLTTQGITAQFFRRNPELLPEDGFAVTPAMLKATGLPETFYDRFENVTSSRNFEATLARAKEDIDAREKVQAAGLKGIAGSFLAEMLDPATLTVTLATGGIGRGMSMPRTINALASGAANAGLEGVRSAVSDEQSTFGEFVMSATVGATFGALFGPAGQRAATQNAADLLAATAQRDAQRLLESIPTTPRGDIDDVLEVTVNAKSARDFNTFEAPPRAANEDNAITSRNPVTNRPLDRVAANDNPDTPRSVWLSAKMSDPTVSAPLSDTLDDLRTVLGKEPLPQRPETGKPIRVAAYHGTMGSGLWNDFDPKFQGKGAGGGDTDGVFYFSGDKQTAAQSYANAGDFTDAERAAIKERQDVVWQVESRLSELNYKTYYTTGDELAVIKAQIKEGEELLAEARKHTMDPVDAYRDGTLKVRELHFKNPYVVTSSGGWDNARNSFLQDQARAGGHDGVILHGTSDGGPITTIYMVLDPDVIRAETSRLGKFEGTPNTREGMTRGAANDDATPVRPNALELPPAANDTRELRATPTIADRVRAANENVTTPDGRFVPHDGPVSRPGEHRASLSAAANLDVEEQRLTDATLRAIQDDIVPRTADTGVAGKAPRWDVAGALGRSDNPLMRMMGSLLFSDKVGKAGHATNRFSADEETKMYMQVKQTAWRSMLMPAFKEWAKETGNRGLFGKGWHDFNKEVWRAVVDRSDAPVSKSVGRARDEFRKLMKEMAEDQNNPQRHVGRQGRPLAGAEFLSPDAYYAPQMWSPSRIVDAITTHGIGRVKETLAGAIKVMQPEIDDDLVTKFATAIIESRYTKTLGHDDRLARLLSNADAAVLRDTLTNEFAFSDDEVTRLLTQLGRSKPTAASGHFKARIQLDPLYVHPDGILSVDELLETSADALMMNYSRGVAGRVALARQRFVDPRNGEVLVDGITSNADFERILNAAAKLGKDLGHTPEQIQSELTNLRWGYDRIRGVPDESQLGDVASWLRVIRNINFSLRMGGLGISSMMDTGRAIGEVTFSAFSQHVPGFRRMLDMDGRLVRASGLDRELEGALGLGADSLRAVQSMIVDDVAGVHGFRGTRAVDKAEAGTAYMGDIVASLSGFHFVQAKLQLTTAKAIAQKFADIAAGSTLKEADRIRLKFGGLDDAMLDRIVKEVKTHSDTADGVLFGQKLTQLHLDKWTDLEASAALSQALFRLSRSIIQENDIGSMHRWMSHSLAQTLLQFRSFSLTAWPNQLLQGAHRGDGRALGTFLWTTLTGGLVYGAQTQIQAIGRSDSQEFLNKRLGDNATLAAAIFQRAGYSSIIPMVVDTASLFFRDKPIFDARPSGQPSDILFGNPTVGLLSDLAKGSREAINSFAYGKPVTQDDLRGWSRLLPANNAIPIANLISATISDQPRMNIR
jgi:hypothetical protein